MMLHGSIQTTAKLLGRQHTLLISYYLSNGFLGVVQDAQHAFLNLWAVMHCPLQLYVPILFPADR
jgi:hypothetical protein